MVCRGKKQSQSKANTPTTNCVASNSETGAFFSDGRRQHTLELANTEHSRGVIHKKAAALHDEGMVMEHIRVLVLHTDVNVSYDSHLTFLTSQTQCNATEH